MIVAAILLALIGTADLARAGVVPDAPRRSIAAAVVAAAVLWGAVLALAATGLGVPPVWLALPVVLAAGWVVTTTADAGARPAGSPAVTPSRHPRLRILPAIAVLLLVASSLFVDPLHGALHGYLVDGVADAPVGAIAAVPVETLALGAGLTLFLVESANIVVRAALRPALSDAVDPAEGALEAGGSSDAVEVEASGPFWWRTRVVVRPGETAADAPGVSDLRGGRLIGPLERLLIVALTLSGALPIVAGLLAAKGIVRFPEISNDRAGGSKAEYFLVGSLVSWALALGSAGVL